MTWLCLKAQHSIATGELKFEQKPLSTSGCAYHFMAENALNMLAVNSTVEPLDLVDETQKASGTSIYHISYLWYTMLGSSITIIVSLIASYLIGFNDPAKMDEKLFAPFVRKLIKRSKSNLPTIQKKCDGSISLNENYLEAKL
jgi:sodium-coupled monocarboxylate transporter 8/12